THYHISTSLINNMNLRNKHREEGEVHTGPLNDILFILLLFFLIVSTMANPNVVKLSQPKSKSDTKAKQTVVVSIDANKQFYVGTTKVTVAELKAHLAPFLAKERDQPSIVINADKTVPIDDVVAVMRVARELGARTVLAVDKTGVQ
ncbi:MAG: biopolymer transporter ExbD, partial [Bacteroidota bacterium]|nr:biopolymer transporter ExbD [Bacteroidota bacterium]